MEAQLIRTQRADLGQPEEAELEDILATEEALVL
jgi:hypothetical protein